ncbi:MBL fold metallo-hydrolase [Vulcanisaeta thermophila]|uniref:MBL fold metallo-hydrolase n=1 Tax=Vulcanisaeta thermophila TaxID=867917 RepID=UPI000853B300|nr:MBL fold metallo-hydrolase [Vulcanisaeta thermophila]
MITRVVVGPLMTNCYLVCEGNECVIVDPGDEAELILRALGARHVLGIVATHGHFDHVNAALDLVSRLNVPLYMHRSDWELFQELNRIATEWGFRVNPLVDKPTFIDEGFELPLNLRVMHTPGHTPGSVSIVGNGFVMTGDTLFSGSVGRTDLPGGDPELLRESVCRLYKELPNNFIVYPGHGPTTTIEYELEYNPVINFDSCE